MARKSPELRMHEARKSVYWNAALAALVLIAALYFRQSADSSPARSSTFAGIVAGMFSLLDCGRRLARPTIRATASGIRGSLSGFRPFFVSSTEIGTPVLRDHQGMTYVCTSRGRRIAPIEIEDADRAALIEGLERVLS